MKYLNSLLLLITLTSLSTLSYARAPQWNQADKSPYAITFAANKSVEQANTTVVRVPNVILLTPLPRRQPSWATTNDSFAPAIEGKSRYVQTLGHTYKRRVPGQLRTRLASGSSYANSNRRVASQYAANTNNAQRYTRVFRQTLGHKFYQPQLVASQF